MVRFFPFKGEEIEAQRSEVTCPRSPSESVGEPGFKGSSVYLRSVLVPPACPAPPPKVHTQDSLLVQGLGTHLPGRGRSLDP